jgi:hypothetical protein
LTAVLIVALAVLVADARLRSALLAYAAFTIAALVLSFPHGTHGAALAAFGGLAFVKIVAGPAALVWLQRTHRLREDLSPSFSIGVRIGVVLVALLLAREIGRMPAFAHVPFAGLVMYAIISSVCVVILHRSLVAHLVGLLALGSAITLAGAIFAPLLPGGMELADTFDAVIATLVGVAVAGAVAAHDPRLDIRSLRELRG